MTPPTLQQLHASHTGKVSDKWSSYLERYDTLLTPFRSKEVRILEIGIQNGGSLEIWAKYFSHAQKIIGCDIEDTCGSLVFSEPNIHVIIGDAKDAATCVKITAHAPAYDIIIDDGSHHSHDIIQTFLAYFPLLSHGGIYIIEDLHCSYWSSHEGGVHHPRSSINFFKLLIDLIHREHWREDLAAEQLLMRFTTATAPWMGEISGITFYNSVCIVEKKASAINNLGVRHITGRQAQVRPEIMPQNAQTCAEMHPAPLEPGSPSPEDIIETLQAEVKNQHAELLTTQSKLHTTQTTLHTLTKSRYWRLRLFIFKLLGLTEKS